MTPRKKKTTSKLPPPPKQEFTQSVDFESIYVNWISATFSPHDISMLVGQSFQTAPGVVGIEHKARIVFSPLEGKLLSVILRKVVGGYEEQFGKIIVPHIIGDQLVEQMPEIAEMMKPKTEGV